MSYLVQRTLGPMTLLMSRSFNLAILLFFCLMHALVAQEPEDTELLDFELLNNEDGLSQGMITCFLKDQHGFLWVGTKDGLNRYDGYGFKVFRKSEADTNTLVDNYITALHEDERGYIWIGTMLNGISRYDPYRDTFFSPDQARNLNKQLRSKSIRSILQDDEGNIWISTSKGFGYLQSIPAGSQPSVESYRVQYLTNYVAGLPEQTYDVLHSRFLQNGALQLHGRNAVLTISYPADSTRASLSSIELHTYCGFEQDELAYPVFDTINRVSYYLSASGITQYDVVNKEIRKTCAISIDLQNFPIPQLDHLGRLWLKTSLGLTRYDPETNTCTKIRSNNRNIQDALLANFHSAYRDPNGILWIGTFGYGILKYTLKRERFGQINQFEGHPMSLSGIYESPAGKLIAQAYQTNDPVMFSLKTDRFEGFFSTLSEDDNGLRNSNSVVFDAKYAYMGHKHLYRIHLETGESDQFLYPDRDPTLIYDPLFIDRKGRLWCANGFPSGEKELLELDKETGEVLHTFRFPEANLHHEYRFVSDWLESADGTFWFGTLQGVYSFHPDAQVWKIHRITASQKQTVFSLCEDPARPDTILWVGTNGFGLKQLDKITGQVESFDMESGLPNNVVYGIEPDDHNNLWISTNNGICLFEPSTGKALNFTVSDGLQAAEFNRYAHLILSDGRIIFGGVNGLNYFDPSVFYKQTEPANTLITTLKINNKSVAVGERVGDHILLESPIEHVAQIELPHDIAMITFSYAYLDLSTPTENHFQYKLEGYNTQWIDGGKQREATYTNLDPGRYTFLVRGSSSHGEWSKQAARVVLNIPPPWWATWWFRMLIVALVALILYGIYRYRLKQVLKVEKVRNRIAQDLHDEIGSTLSSISLYSTVMQKTSGQLSEKNHYILDKITDSTTSMMESMNDIVWTIQATNDQFKHVVNRMRAFAVNMTEACTISLHFESDQEAENLKLDMVQRKNVYLIFKEAVNNAIKYSEGSELKITVQYSPGNLILSVADDGKGFEPDSARDTTNSMGGNGLRSMQARASECQGKLMVTSAPGRGTSVVFALRLQDRWR